MVEGVSQQLRREIIGLTDAGQVTVNLLRLNDDERVLERRFLGRIGEYPGRRPSG